MIARNLKPALSHPFCPARRAFFSRGTRGAQAARISKVFISAGHSGWRCSGLWLIAPAALGRHRVEAALSKAGCSAKCAKSPTKALRHPMHLNGLYHKGEHVGRNRQFLPRRGERNFDRARTGKINSFRTNSFILPALRRTATFKTGTSFVLFSLGVMPRATSTISYLPTSPRSTSLSAARITRRARLRVTALPTF